MGRINPLVAIGIPTWGKTTIRWSRAYRHLGGPLGSVIVELEPVEGKPIAAARNEIMQNAIMQGADFLFFLGDDVLAPGDAIIRLLHRMWDDPELDLATGVYWTKSWPTSPYLWRGMQRGPYLDWVNGEFFQVDQCGCDCLMIRLSDRVKALANGWQERGADGPDWFSTDWWWEPTQGGPSELATEDFYFYTRARRAGIKLMCDSNVQCLHEDRMTGALFGLTYDMPQAGGVVRALPEAGTDVAPLVKVAEIGCGIDTPWFGTAEDVQVVRFDGNEAVRPDYRCDLRSLPVPDQSFDLVHSRHVLEHFGRADVMRVMKEWTRILRVGGEFRISVPNLMWTLDQIKAQEDGTGVLHPYPWWQLYGEQTDQYDFHKNGFTPKRMQDLIERMGIFDQIEVTTGDEGMNLYARAVKTRHPEAYSLIPTWDAIEEAEGFQMAGLRRRETEPSIEFSIDEKPAEVGEALAALAGESKGRRNGHSKEKVPAEVS